MTTKKVVGIEPHVSTLIGMMKNIESATSAFVCMVRVLNGVVVLPGIQLASDDQIKQPKKLLKLYEFEGCPDARRVREALSILDLDCIMIPVPRGGNRFRSELQNLQGKTEVPFLVDENTNVSLGGPYPIVRYLFTTYGPPGVDPESEVPKLMKENSLTNFSLWLSTLGRKGRGRTKLPTNEGIEPEVPSTDSDQKPQDERNSIEMYGFEASPYSRLVREVLSELELPYIQRNLAKGSRKREDFAKSVGKMQVPYLVDSNKKKGDGKVVKLFESGDIIKYLRATYMKENADLSVLIPPPADVPLKLLLVNIAFWIVFYFIYSLFF